jgi:hypothetical protein
MTASKQSWLKTSSILTAWNKIWIINAFGWLFKNKSITMQHGNVNVKQKSNFTSYTECIPDVNTALLHK